MNRVELRRWQRQAVANPLATAFVISLSLHLTIFGLYQAGKHFGWHEPAFLTALRQLIDQKLFAVSRTAPPTNLVIPRPDELEREKEMVVPLTFVEVDPSTVVTDPPKDAKYYSSASTLAANPDTSKNTETPKIDGKQKQVTRVVESPRPTAQPLTPSPPKQDEPEQPKEPEKKTETKPVVVAKAEPLPKGGEQKGDLTRDKSAPQPRKTTGTAEQMPKDAVATVTTPQEPQGEPKRTRPRTVAAARAAQPQSPTAGEKMQQEGGVKRFNVSSSLSVVGTPFGSYDAAIIAAIQARWYSLLDGKFTPVGKVVVEFNLHSNGTISNLHAVKDESTVDSLFQYLCESAIQDPSPYAVWPPDMKRAIGSDVREVRFTFYYN